MAHLLNRGTFLASLGLLAGLTGTAIAQKSDDATNFTGTSGVSDTQFARNAALGGMTAVQLGKIAVQKASNDKVKEFAQRMVDDHSRVGDELSGIAAKESLVLPNELDAKHKAVVDRFSKMAAGSDFDRAYMRDMVRDHHTDIAAFEKEAAGGQNPDLKNWAGNTLPTLRDHLRMAEDAQRAVGTTITSSLKK
jgi:putative membrane protein